MRRLEFVIPPEYDEKTVYTFLKGKVRISLAFLRSLKRVENGIELNGVHTRTVDLIHSGDILSINIPDDGVCAEDDGKIKTQAHCDPEIIFEDESKHEKEQFIIVLFIICLQPFCVQYFSIQ